MTELSIPLGAISNQAKCIDHDWHKNQTCWNFTAFLCPAGGVSFGIINLFLSVAGYFFGADRIDFKIGTILVSSSFPLMMFGAHALDIAAKNDRKKKTGE